MAQKVMIAVYSHMDGDGFKNKNARRFYGKPLSHYTLSAIELFLKDYPQVLPDVVLCSNSPMLREIVRGSYGGVTNLSLPVTLQESKVSDMLLFQYSLAAMEREKHMTYDYQICLDINQPIRCNGDISACYDTLRDNQDLDLVTTGVPVRKDPYSSMAMQAYGKTNHIMPPYAHGVTQKDYYDLNQSIFIFRRDFLAQGAVHSFWDGNYGIVPMHDTGVLDICSDDQYAMMEVMAGYMYRTYPAFEELKDNIR